MASREFALSGAFPAPAFVVTACAAGRRAGCVVGFATEVSIDPGRFLVCISRENATFAVAMQASRPAVHTITEGERGIAQHAERWQDGGEIAQLTVRDLGDIAPGHPA